MCWVMKSSTLYYITLRLQRVRLSLGRRRS
jgi:hypothetical protein